MSDDESDGAEVNPVVSVLQTITPEFIRSNFAIKFGLVLLVMALSIGVIGFLATQAVTGETEDNVKAEFQSDAGQQADIVEGWLASNSLQVEIQSDKGEYHVDDRADVENELANDLERAADEVHAMHVLEDDDFEGLVLYASTDDWATPLPLADTGDGAYMEGREWIKEARGENIQEQILDLGTDEVYVSETYEADGVPMVAYISPSALDDNRYLFMEVSVLDVQNSLRGGADADEDTGFTQVVSTGSYLGDPDQTNTVVMDARPEDDKLLQVYATDESTLEPIRLANDLRGESDRAGVIAEMSADEDVIDEVYTVGYSPVEGVEGKNWVVLAHGPRSAVFGFVDTLSTWGIIVTFFAVVLIGVTGAALGYSTSTSIDRLTRKTEEMREGDLDVDLETTRVDNIGRLYEGFADMRDALKGQIQQSERARKEAEVARAEAENMAEYLQEKAQEYSDIMQQVGAGDLTQRMTKDGEEASMDRIADEFNDMITELEKTTGQLKSYVDEVEEAGAEVEESATTVRQASEQVADSIQKISDDAHDQKERLRRIGGTISDVADQLDWLAQQHSDVDIDDSLDDIQSIAQDVQALADLSEDMMAETEEVAGASEEQAAELTEVSERANDLQRYAQPLRDILERFETEAEHEFVFSVGPTGGAASPSSRDGDGD